MFLASMDLASINAGNGMIDRKKIRNPQGNAEHNQVDFDKYVELRKMQSNKKDPRVLKLKELLKQKIESQKEMRLKDREWMQSMMEQE